MDLNAYSQAQSLTDNNTKLTIGTVKTMDYNYGIDILINAFAILNKKLTKTHPELAKILELRLVGGGSKIHELKCLANHLKIQEKVNFIGYISHNEIPKEFAKLDIYVALSRSESFGVAVIEAGAARRPVIVSDVGGLPEVTIDGKTGIVVPANDPQSAADALEKLVLSPKLRIAMGEAGRNHVTEAYRWETCIDTMIQVYNKAIANKV